MTGAVVFDECGIPIVVAQTRVLLRYPTTEELTDVRRRLLAMAAELQS